MKRAISIFVLIFLLFIGFEFLAIYLKDEHEVKYEVYYEDKVFEIKEKYIKENGNTYNIEIKNSNQSFYYIIDNRFNKQKEIIEKIEYFEKDNYACIYPILENGEGTYLECSKDGKIYSSSYLQTKDFITEISDYLFKKGYSISKQSDTTNTKKLDKSIVYTNNLLANDFISLWDYKGIDIISTDDLKNVPVLNFDKYENKHGYLVDKYYIVPVYLSNKVLEFSSVNIINLEDSSIETIELDNTLSSRTYINGVVDNKLYYTDPSNLIQLEINPKDNSSRLVGNKEIGGQLYNGSWNNYNIYDLAKNEVKFKVENQELSKYNYIELEESAFSYYLYTKEGNMYQVPKDNLDTKILLFNLNDLSNINVVSDTIYFVKDNMLYYYSNKDGIIPVIQNNELRYNTYNRIQVYRK